MWTESYCSRRGMHVYTSQRGVVMDEPPSGAVNVEYLENIQMRRHKGGSWEEGSAGTGGDPALDLDASFGAAEDPVEVLVGFRRPKAGAAWERREGGGLHVVRGIGDGGGSPAAGAGDYLAAIGGILSKEGGAGATLASDDEHLAGTDDSDSEEGAGASDSAVGKARTWGGEADAEVPIVVTVRSDVGVERGFDVGVKVARKRGAKAEEITEVGLCEF